MFNYRLLVTLYAVTSVLGAGFMGTSANMRNHPVIGDVYFMTGYLMFLVGFYGAVIAATATAHPTVRTWMHWSTMFLSTTVLVAITIWCSTVAGLHVGMSCMLAMTAVWVLCFCS